MMNFSTRKIILVATVCLLGLLFAMPNFLPDGVRGELPSFIPSKTVNLGLDLRGGSQLLLEVDVSAVIDQELDDLVDQIRTALRTEKIGYTGLGVNSHMVGLNLRDAAEGDKAVEAIRKLAVPIQQSLLGGNSGLNLLVTREDSRITVALTEAAIADRSRNAVAQSMEVIRRRVDETGTKEPTIQRQGENRILVQLPGVQDPDRMKELLGTTAKLSFRFLDQSMSVEQAKATHVPPEDELLQGLDKTGEAAAEYLVRKRVMVSGENLKNAQPGFEQQTNRPVVTIRFDSIGAKRFADATRDNVGKLFAIVLDDKVISAPRINEPILQGSAQISGSFTTQQTQDMALLLRAGALPAPMTIGHESTVGPDLGADSIAEGELACLIGAALVVLFMMAVYGFFGFLANMALVVNVILLFGVLSALQATLTLPGIAGIVLTIGMAVDANVLIYERIKEEARLGKTPFNAVDSGFSRAMVTILDANLTTLITGVILYLVGTGPVKGFAVTLSIGVCTSVFTAVTVTRLFVAIWLRRRRPQVLPIV
jgi:preprotein translocase subunit SecD